MCGSLEQILLAFLLLSAPGQRTGLPLGGGDDNGFTAAGPHHRYRPPRSVVMRLTRHLTRPD
jgi:hypothetical protein